MTYFNPTALSHRIESVPARRFVLAAAAAIAAIGIIDHFTGPVVSLAIFYMFPVAAAAWVIGPGVAYALATLAAVTWALADRIGPLAEPKTRLAYLNDISMLVLLIIIAAVIAALRRQVLQQRELMQDVQRHLLPETLPRLRRLDLAARWMPAWTVAGDYYDVIEIEPGLAAVCLADVSGKGVTAALIMSNVQAIVRTVATDRRDAAPDRMLAMFNRLLCERLRSGFFVTAFYGLIDTNNGTLSFASAGHTPALLRRADGSVERLVSTGPAAGILAGAAYHCRDLPLHDGDSLVIYSDGVTEYENAAGEQFGEARLSEILSRSRAETAEETCAAIAASLQEHGRERPFGDDVTLLACRFAYSSATIV